MRPGLCGPLSIFMIFSLQRRLLPHTLDFQGAPYSSQLLSVINFIRRIFRYSFQIISDPSRLFCNNGGLRRFKNRPAWKCAILVDQDVSDLQVDELKAPFSLPAHLLSERTSTVENICPLALTLGWPLCTSFIHQVIDTREHQRINGFHKVVYSNFLLQIFHWIGFEVWLTACWIKL